MWLNKVYILDYPRFSIIRAPQFPPLLQNIQGTLYVIFIRISTRNVAVHVCSHYYKLHTNI